MALEDTVAKYTVQIVQSGSTAPTVQQFNDLRTAAAATNTSFAATKTAAAETASSFENLGGKVYYVRSSIDAVRFAAMNGGTRAGFYAIDEAIRAMIQSGLKMGTIIPVFGGIAAVIGAGILVWHEWTSAEDAAIKKAKDLAEAYKALPALLKEVSDAQEGGLLGPGAAGEYSDYLTGKKKLYQGFNGQLTTSPNSIIDAATASKEPWLQAGQQLSNQPATAAQIQKWVQDQITAGGAVTQTQIDALNKLADLTQKINEQSLTGIDKEKAAIHDRYQAERDEIEQTLKVAGANLGDINALSPKREQAAKSAYQQTYFDENSADNALQQKSEADQEKGGYAQFDSIIKQMQAADALLKQGNAETEQTLAEIRQTAQAKQQALDEVTTKTRELQRLENEVTLSNLTGEAKKQEAIKQTTQAWITEFDDLARELGMSEQQIDEWNQKINEAAKNAQQQTQDTESGVKSMAQMGVGLEHNFEDGIADAMVDFADKTKTAKQAFEDFARSYLENAAKMLAQNAMRGLFGQNGVNGAGGSGIFGMLFSGSSFTGAAKGGIFSPRMMADGGFAAMFSAPTYFPRFNVVGGEAGTEMLAALAKPTFRSIGGMDAVVGHAGPNRLAITSADDLARRGGGGAGGHIHIQIDHTPETQARIISQAIDGAEVRVTKNMNRNTKLRQSTRGATTA
jgi:hypothetical protein